MWNRLFLYFSLSTTLILIGPLKAQQTENGSDESQPTQIQDQQPPKPVEKATGESEAAADKPASEEGHDPVAESPEGAGDVEGGEEAGTNSEVVESGEGENSVESAPELGDGPAESEGEKEGGSSKVSPELHVLIDTAKSGNTDAQVDLAVVYSTGSDGIEKNSEEAAKWAKEASTGGNLAGDYLYGIFLLNGDGLPMDEKKAIEVLTNSANFGFPASQLAVARLYASGQGVIVDMKKAFVWTRRAAWQGYPAAQTALGIMYLRAEGVERDVEQGMNWIGQALAAGTVEGAVTMGNVYYEGLAGEIDYDRARSFFTRASDEGSDLAINALAWMLSTCPNEFYHDGKRAVGLAEKVIGNGNQEEFAYVDTLAAALARDGQWEAAVKNMEKALSLLEKFILEKAPKGQILEQLQKDKMEFHERLKLFQEQKPWSDKPSRPLPAPKPPQSDGDADAEDFV